MNVANRACVRNLSRKSMAAARTRNIVAIAAIALTTILFTSLFTIALSINDAMQQNSFRMVGGYAHCGFKYLTQEQVDTLKTDPMAKAYSLRRFVGMPTEAPFQKSHVEVGYSDTNCAKWSFCEPVEGRLPAEGTNEAATDTRVLSLLGVEPKIGAQFTMTFDVDGAPTTQTFTLSGYWEYDGAGAASHVLIPASRAQAIFDALGTTGKDGMTGFWNLDFMLRSSLNIERDLQTVLQRHGYQSESRAAGDNYIATGVNWAYTGAQLSQKADPITVGAIVGLLAVIVFTGYLIIYNVFRISVTNDIRFYGLLKTIGATGRQLRRIVRMQALVLCVAGIPLGLLAGYGVGVLLTPALLAQLNGVQQGFVSANPLIFVGAAAFSFVTVLLSCAKPGRIAAKVSPVEAVRYTESSDTKKTLRRTQKGASLPRMAAANLGRSRSKTVVTVASLSLAVVLLNLTVTFTNGFDLDKYVSKSISTDFIFAHAGYFQVGNGWSKDMAVSEEVLSQITAQPGIADGGRIYGQATSVKEFVSEDYMRKGLAPWFSAQELDEHIARQQRTPDGLLEDNAQLFGMERFALDNLSVLEGDVAKLHTPGSRSIAAVYMDDDYGVPNWDSHWARLGDKITLRHVEQYEYYDYASGTILDPANLPDDGSWARRVKEYRDVEYTVDALVLVPHSLGYRMYGTDQFVLNDQTFMEDTGTSDVMLYTCNMQDGADAGMETFLSAATENTLEAFDYESKETYKQEFESFRGMFLLLGGALSFIVGLVGVLNFVNAILTGILTRRREFAVLQSVGMTDTQLKTMLMTEGLLYALLAAGAALALCLVTGPMLGQAFGSMFWFFTYRFTIGPVLWLTPLFAALGLVLPPLLQRSVAKQPIVERLRAAE